MTATLPADLAASLGLSSVGAEAVLVVTEIAPDGGVVVESEMEDAEEAPGSAPAPALPPELSKILGA